MDQPTSTSPRIRPIDIPLIILIGLGFPLSQVAIRILGRRGAAIVEAVAGALLARDVQLLAAGTGCRSRSVPAALLCLETAAACAAVVLGLRSLTSHGVRVATARKPGAWEVARRVAFGTLFGLRSWRLAIRRGRV